MPAVSKAQKNFFALALKVKQGKIPAQEVSDELAKAAKEYDEKEIKAYAETPDEGLPDKVGEGHELDEMEATATPASVGGMGAISFPGNPGSQSSFSTQETGSGDLAATSALTDGNPDKDGKKSKKIYDFLKYNAFVGESVKELEPILEASFPEWEVSFKRMNLSGVKLDPKKSYKVKARGTAEAIKKAAISAGLSGDDWMATETNSIKKL